MKKSEKTKGKERAAEKKKQTLWYAAAGIAIIVVIAVLFFMTSPPVAQEGDTVSVAYVGMLDDKSVFDSNVNGTPLSFTIGAHTMIPGFENVVVGMKTGEEKTVTIPADQAYGTYQDDLVYTVNRSLFAPDSPPSVGSYYTFTTTSGATNRVKVINVTDSTVTIDANHMLAGENLTFTIRMLEITKGK
jgi:FKBP-type peptidyl-prolyl cis-trans isomerase 2